MEFLHPEFLYYMLPPLFILFWFLLTQKESQASYFSDEVMKKLRVSSKRLTLKVRNFLFLIIATLLVIALAQPVIPEGVVQIKAKSADIMIGLDISDSMLGEDVYPNRLKLAKQKALELLRLAPNERIGVIAFAQNSYLVSPLSFDHDAVSFLLRELSTDSITEQGTDFLSMLEVVNKSVKNESKKYLLILSDGGDKEDFAKEIAYAKEKSIAVFILGVGTSKGAPIKLENGEFIKQNGDIIISKLNENIASLATKTGGVYIESVNANDDVVAMLKEIEAHSEKKELKSKEIARFVPLFYIPIGLALFLLLIATSSMSKRESVNLPSAFIVFAILAFAPKVDAGLLDFMTLKNAKDAYEKQEYEKSATLYKDYAEKTNSSEAYYNAANALYKQEKYEDAITLYKKAHFQNRSTRAKNFANLGNSFTKVSDLSKAIESYESSLKIEENKEVRENLEAVKKALKEQNKEEQKEEKGDEGEQNEEQESQEESDSNSTNESQKNEGEESQENKENKEDASNSKKEKQETQNENKQSQENQDEENKNESMNQEEQNPIEELKDEQEKEQTQEDEKQEDTKTPSQSGLKTKEMSEEEQAKWLNKLNQKSATYLYRLSGQNRHNQEHSNEKPW